MKSLKKLAVAGVTSAMIFTSLSATAFASENNSVDEANQLMKDLNGTYCQLFDDAIFKEEYNQLWYNYSAAVIGNSMADTAVSMLKSVVGGDKYGSEAAENVFCCKFINGTKEITFNDGEISVLLDNNTTETHKYNFVREDAIGGVMPGYLFESADDNNDEFKYFFICGDTPETTYHIEFRYGDSVEELLQYNTGKYANWVGSGILKSAAQEENKATINNVIALFCTENLSEMVNDETTKQRNEIAGIWDADLTEFRSNPAFSKAEMYCVLNSDGTGATYLDLNGTGDFIKTSSYTFYAYNTFTSDNLKSGVYIPVNDETEHTEAGKYELATANDKTTLTFTTLEGESISYIKRVEKPQPSTTVTEPTTVAPETSSPSVTDATSVTGATVAATTSTAKASTSDTAVKNNNNADTVKTGNSNLSIAIMLTVAFGALICGKYAIRKRHHF